MSKIRVKVWNEFIHEQQDEVVRKIYGKDGIHGWIAKFLQKNYDNFTITTGTLDDDEMGLDDLDETDVLIWWGHAGHHMVMDEFVDKIQKRIIDGMGLIVLHSGHFSKIFKRMMGTSCGLLWREVGERELLWCINPWHPIMNGIDAVIEIPMTEMYGEVFDIPKPDDVLMVSNFEGGEVFRSVCTFTRGRGKIVYIRPGHETFPIYIGEEDYSQQILKIIANSCKWANFRGNRDAEGVGNAKHQVFHLAPIAKKDFQGLEAHPDSSNK